ncbi:MULTISPECIES: L,D-transpeptidase family protein [Photorhabdus]|uniref:Exported protein YafK n=2 Tax=Photorhabdus asymbiotica TaxID=291112 RepID=C7BI04_PHOAA|nr:murein L,D-transpeptidase family protein [Photorhabdus asymbiotica]RKS58220.1 murein L,D-transpeptidase YafK [Photorhabdus asymbiotica]CAQ85346.1 putative exported protein YafK [Photorhabdus asymbiotica]
MKKTAAFAAIILMFFSSLPPTYAQDTPIELKSTPSTQLGYPVFIQIFKEERILELYTKDSHGNYQLAKSYPICNYSGGLGPKTMEGDLKSPEGFYRVKTSQLNPNSRYYRSINLGFPNEYDKSRGYSGNYLMIHGECKSVGCYAMTNNYMNEIYHYVESALLNGQYEINISIYPFRMTPQNMLRHQASSHYMFWLQLQPAYEYFIKTRRPAAISVINNQYAVNDIAAKSPLSQNQSQYAFTKVK